MLPSRLVLLSLFIFIGLCFSQCGGGSSFEHFDEGTRFVLRSDSGIFRGIFTDMSLPNVKTHEQATLVEEEKDYLRYTHSGEPLDGEAEYEYFFAGQDQLDRIVATIQIYNEANLNQLRNDLTAYYDHRFTKHEETENGMRKWEFVLLFFLNLAFKSP